MEKQNKSNIDQLEIDSKIKAELETITPFNYTGL